MAGVDLSGSKESKAEPNVVPLCDILLVLLIIFMVVTPLVNDYRNVKLPEAFHTKPQPQPFSMLTVYIKDNGTIYLDKEEVPGLEKLASLIEDKIQGKAPSEQSKLLLKADENIIYERVTRVMAEIQQTPIEIVGLVARKKITVE